MRLIGRERLGLIGETNHSIAKWLTSWTAELRDAHWKQPLDVSSQFPKAYRESDGSFLFPMPQHHIGIHVLIAFAHGVVLIVAIKMLEAANGR